MAQSTTERLAAARNLVRSPSGRPEDNVRQDIVRLLDALGIESLLTYRTDAGPADLYLPRRRLFIETKAAGLADGPDQPQSRESGETPKEQLERYLRSEIALEHETLPSEDPGDDPTWIGILTDGRVWHAWRYPHQEGAIGRDIFMDFRPSDPGQLLSRVGDLFGRKPIGKPWIPPNPREILGGYLDGLREIHDSLEGRHERETRTKLQLWLDMLRTSSMAPENPNAQARLFVAHSFLVAVARGVIHTLAHQEDPDPGAILGDGFVSWALTTAKGRDWAGRLLGDIHSYEWRRRRGDVLRPLYEAIVDDRDRKVFGEYYTPDWLAELLVEEMLDEKWCEGAVSAAMKAERGHRETDGVGILDPACGSGTFLYHSVRRLLRSPAIGNLPRPRAAGLVASLVHGIDIHPVAAEIARATVLRALPAEPPDGPSAIRVFQGDSLITRSHDPDSLFRPVNGDFRIDTPTGNEMHIPRSFVTDRYFVDSLRRMVDAAADGKGLPSDIADTVPEGGLRALERCHESLKRIIGEEGNSVWAWYITNITAPLRLSERKVDRILANPPWVRMADIQVEGRKRALEDFAGRRLDLWAGGKQAPHFDIAQLFLKRARGLYLRDPGADPAAWIVKKAAMHAGNWEKFRNWHRSVLGQSLDLEALRPFGPGDSRRCCVFLENRSLRMNAEIRGDALVATLRDRDRPTADMGLKEAQELFDFRSARPRLDETPSGYLDSRGKPLFRNGATIVPKVLLLVARETREGGARGDVRVKTVISGKAPWSDIGTQEGDVPGDWVRNLHVPTDMYPFVMSDRPTRAIIPVDDRGRLADSPSDGNEFWGRMESLWREFRGKGRNTPRTLVDQIDYAGKLSSQLPLPGYCSPRIVLYNASGDHMRACRVTPCLVGNGLYRWTAPTASEAAYLTALLNAPSLDEAFYQARESGKHFHLHPWRKVPIPKFDPRNGDHAALARLARRAETVAREWLERNPAIRSQVAASRRIRELLRDTGIFPGIDELAGKILPDHAVKTITGGRCE